MRVSLSAPSRFGARRKEVLQRIDLPKTRPAFDDFVIGDGRIWIDVADRGDSLSTWHVVDLTTHEVSTTLLPKNVSIKTIRNGHLYTLQMMEYDTYEVVVYKEGS